MKRCPICKTVFPDDANFCPMDAGRLVDATGMSQPMPAVGADQPTMATKLVGGRFQVGAELGGHRTGKVFAAEDATTGAPCVVKLISSRVFPTPLVQQRTERELKQLMKVASDRVVKILEVGRQAERIWVACELVTGVQLGELVQANGPMAPLDAVKIACEVGEALAEAAKLGVIHRDVSPKNILIDGERVKVMNFGVPTPISDKLFGIPEFVSPEQAEAKPVDQRSNIYSLGALLYFMLTSEPPFSGDMAAVLQAHAQTPPPPLSQRLPGVTVPREIEKVVLKALEKQPSKRHLTLRQLLSELETAVGLPSRSPPASASLKPSSKPLQPPPPSAQVAVPIVPPKPAPAPAVNPAETLIGVAPLPSVAMAAAKANGNSGAVPAIPVDTLRDAPAVETLRGTPAITTKPQAVIVKEAPSSDALPAASPTPILLPAQPVEPAPSPPSPAPPPPPAPKPATQASLDKAGASSSPAGKRKGEPGGGKRKGKFRETMWFKKGELDEAAALAASQKAAEGQPVSDKSDELPIEDRYKDDGTLTAQDRERLSLRTGATQTHAAVKDAVVPGKRMNVAELARELVSGRNKLVALVVGAIVVLAGILVYFLVIRK